MCVQIHIITLFSIMYNRNYYINNLMKLLNFIIVVIKKYILKFKIKKNIYFIILQKIKIL